MTPSNAQDQLGKALIDFSTDGKFPEDESVPAAILEGSALSEALRLLNNAKAALESEVRTISHESASDVESWITHAKSLQDEIENSRKLASDIVRQAKVDENREEFLRDKQDHLEFISKELAFHSQLLGGLHAVQDINAKLDQAEQLIEDRKVLEALRLLEDAWKAIERIQVDKHTRAVVLLDQRCFRLRDLAHGHLSNIWNHLIHVDSQERTITINKTLSNEATSLDEAITALKAYKELDKAAVKLWEDLDRIIVTPRIDLRSGSLASISVIEESITTSDQLVDHTIKTLFRDIEAVIIFLTNNLPLDFIKPLSVAMMPNLSARIKEDWLDTAVPSSLDDMVDYQKALAQVDDFAAKLQMLDWPGVSSFNDWVSNSPKIWLAKRRESALDWVRNELSLGIGTPQYAERFESRMLHKDEGTSLMGTNNQDWDAAWDSDNEADSADNGGSEKPVRNKHSMEEERRQMEVITSPPPDDDNDAADAWGWGDDADEAGSSPPETSSQDVLPTISPSSELKNADVRQVTMTEKYWTSSMPRPVMKMLVQMFDDGAQLINPENEHIPVAPAAPGLFGLPSLILAMYRAVGPFYYSNNPCGNMFLYNDAMWLVGQLKDFVTTWTGRKDLPSRAYGMVRLDTEIKVMESFGKRAYTNELNSQRTVINDLLGGTQNFFQDDTSDQEELKQRAITVVEHIRSKATSWEKILSPSALGSAIGSLVNAIAIRLINDIFDMSSMSVAEAETAATVISIVEKLDDLFLPSGKDNSQNGSGSNEEQIPMTAQFADKWMKMKYLSQTLQSNLNDIHFLWFESELSYYFTADEVVDLIELSFENNVQVRGEVRKIRENPHPRGEAR